MHSTCFVAYFWCNCCCCRSQIDWSIAIHCVWMLQMINDSIGKQLSYTWILMTTNRQFTHTHSHTPKITYATEFIHTLRGQNARSYSFGEEWGLLIRHTQNINEHLGVVTDSRSFFFSLSLYFVTLQSTIAASWLLYSVDTFDAMISLMLLFEFFLSWRTKLLYFCICVFKQNRFSQLLYNIFLVAVW